MNNKQAIDELNKTIYRMEIKSCLKKMRDVELQLNQLRLEKRIYVAMSLGYEFSDKLRQINKDIDNYIKEYNTLYRQYEDVKTKFKPYVNIEYIEKWQPKIESVNLIQKYKSKMKSAN